MEGSHMPRLRLTSLSLLFVVVGVLLSTPAFAQKIGADPAACQGGSSVCTHHLKTYSFVSLTEGNVAETYSSARVTSAFGPTLMFNMIYNSYNADGTRASIDTGMGYGWTHSYNDFLFRQGDDIFRWQGDGRVTRFSPVSGGYQATPGYFETLVVDPSGPITITDKYQTTYRYQLLASPIGQPSIPLSPGDPLETVFRLTRITDRNNNVTTLSYPNGKDLKTVTDTFGRTLTFAYNDNDHLASVTDPLGQVTTFSYDSTGSLLMAIKDPLDHTTNYTYNSLHQITAKTDRDGRLFTIAYQFNLPFSEKDANGTAVYALSNTSNWATDPNQLDQNYLRVYIPSTTSETDGRGNVWKYNYDSNGFPLTISAPDGATTTYTYTPNTLEAATKTDANGNTTSYQYDSEGNLIQVIDANADTTRYTYDAQFNQTTSMTDPQGRVTTYGLDSHGDRTSETDPLGGTKRWTYDSHGNILTETDKNGNTTTYTYDPYGNHLHRVDALQQVTTYGYDIVGNMTSVIDANNHPTSYNFDSLYRLTLVTDALNHTKQYAYDGEGDKTTSTDENGNATNYTYDQRRSLVKTTNAVNNSATNSYDANNNRVSMTDFNSHTTLYSFDVQNRQVSTTDALEHVSSYGYDAVGNRTSETDTNGHTTTIAFDVLNRKVRSTDALGEVTAWSYDLTGLAGCPQCTGPTLGSSLATKQIDGSGKVVYWAYDGLDRLIINIHKQGPTDYVITPNDAVNRHAYDANSNHVAMTDPVGNTTTYAYDALNRMVRTVNAAGDTTKTTYDPVGNTATITYPNLNVVSNLYDAANRPIQESDSAGRVGTLTFDPAGNITSATDGNKRTMRFVYDPLNRVLTYTDPLCETHSVCRPSVFTYDAEGNQLSTSDRNGNMETYAYDAINRPISVTNSLGHTSHSQYDAVDNVTQLTDGNGHATSVVYDAVNRAISETYADASNNTVTWAYDKVGKVTSRTDQKGQTTTYTYSDLYFATSRSYFPSGATDVFTYDLAGRKLTETHAGWTDTFTYDGANRVLSTVQNGHTISYKYDVPGRTRTITYPGGRTVTEQMDIRSRLATVNDGGPTPIVQYAYDQANNILTRAYRNGTLATYTYNPNNWILSVEHTLGSHRLLGFQYTYDAEGNPLSQNKLTDPNDSETFARNTIYQLIDYKAGVLVNGTISNPITQTAYTLDPVGNWEKTITSFPGGTRTQVRTHSPSNEITAINGSPLVSDFNGNLTDDRTTLYSYDEENRLIKAVDKASGHVLGQYQYDVVGRRVSTIDSFGVQTFYYYDGVRTIEEQSASGATLATYVFGHYVDEVLTMGRVQKNGSQTFYYHQNALHSVFALTNSAGAVVEAYDYDAYGVQTVILPGADGVIHYDERDVKLAGAKSSYGNPFFYTGQRYDPDTGLMYYKQRYYSPVLGRFMSRDPVGIWSDVNNLGNGYAYVGDNPATWADPYGTGLRKWLKKLAKAITNAANNVAKAVQKVAIAVAKVATNVATSVAFNVISKVAGVLGDIAEGADKLIKVGTWLRTNVCLANQNWLQHAFDWIEADAVPFIEDFLKSTVAKVAFGAAACVSLVSDVADIVAHGLQPDKTVTTVVAGLVGIDSNAEESKLAGDIYTVYKDVQDGIDCAGFIAYLAAL